MVVGGLKRCSEKVGWAREQEAIRVFPLSSKGFTRLSIVKGIDPSQHSEKGLLVIPVWISILVQSNLGYLRTKVKLLRLKKSNKSWITFALRLIS